MTCVSNGWLSGLRGGAVLLIGLASSAVGYAHELHSHSVGENGEIHVHELSVAITCASPPYYYLNGKDTGVEWSLIAAAFEKSGHPATALYIPTPEAMNALRMGLIDSVWTCGKADVVVQSGLYPSATLLPRHFVAISLADRGISITSVADLNGKRVALHPEVEAVIAEPLRDVGQNDPSVRLISNHALLELMLYMGEIDVLVAEKATFEYYREKLPKRVHPEQSLAFFPIFATVYPRLIFTDQILRGEFDSAWNALHEDDGKERGPRSVGALHAPQITEQQGDQE
jgi:polar amino acid transport system substrate-binding protein